MHLLSPGMEKSSKNSLVSLSVVLQRVSEPTDSKQLVPLVCQGITGGQWYQPDGVLIPMQAMPDTMNVTLPCDARGGLGQRNVSAGMKLHRGVPSVFLMYTNLILAVSAGLSGTNYALSVAATCKQRGK